MMHALRSTVAVLAAVVLASSCSSSSESTWSPTLPPAHDASVQEVLPTGSFLVEGSASLGDKPNFATLEGYVSFGDAPDGVDCTADFTAVDSRDGKTTKVQTVRAPGGPSWNRDLNGSDRWRDTADWNAPGALFMFWPSIVVSEFSIGIVPGAGENWLCGIPLMSRFTSLDASTDTTATLRFAYDKVDQSVAANQDRWVAAYLDAVGVKGRTRDRAASALTEFRGGPTRDSIMGSVLTIERQADGSVRIEQRNDAQDLLVSLTFTPTAERVVSAPAGVVPFYEQIARRSSGGKVDDEKIDQAIEKLEALLDEG